jgi:hypothetical protein
MVHWSSDIHNSQGIASTQHFKLSPGDDTESAVAEVCERPWQAVFWPKKVNNRMSQIFGHPILSRREKINVWWDQNTVAYLRHARTVTSKHAPTITQQYTKRCFLCAETNHDESRIASSHLVCCQATAINAWMTQEWGRVTWPHQQWHHAFQQWHNNWRVPRLSDQEFIGKTEARYASVLDGR